MAEAPEADDPSGYGSLNGGLNLPVVANIFEASPKIGVFRQSEIITGLALPKYDFETEDVTLIKHEYCLVLNQDCDLSRDYEGYVIGQGALDGILLFHADPWPEVMGRFSNKTERKYLFQNKIERYHCLEKVPSHHDLEGEGVPDLIIDFRRFFTIPPASFYWQVKNGMAKRRCILMNPYKEHLQSRASFYLSRVALPREHSIEINAGFEK